MFDFDFVKAQIKTYISVRDILDKYVGNTREVKNRYKCPFNPNEDRYNFGIKGEVWHCFSCGCSGDQITLVRKLYDLSVTDAMKKIAYDFNLNTEANSKDELRLRAEAERRDKQRKKDQEYEAKMRKLETNLYIYIIDKIKEFEKELKENSPSNEGSKEQYRLSDKPIRYLHAKKKLEEYNHYADILCEIPTPEYNPFETGMTKEELHSRLVNFLNKVYKGEIVI